MDKFFEKAVEYRKEFEKLIVEKVRKTHPCDVEDAFYDGATCMKEEMMRWLEDNVDTYAYDFKSGINLINDLKKNFS